MNTPGNGKKLDFNEHRLNQKSAIPCGGGAVPSRRRRRDRRGRNRVERRWWFSWSVVTEAINISHREPGFGQVITAS